MLLGTCSRLVIIAFTSQTTVRRLQSLDIPAHHARHVYLGAAVLTGERKRHRETAPLHQSTEAGRASAAGHVVLEQGTLSSLITKNRRLPGHARACDLGSGAQRDALTPQQIRQQDEDFLRRNSEVISRRLASHEGAAALAAYEARTGICTNGMVGSASYAGIGGAGSVMFRGSASGIGSDSDQLAGGFVRDDAGIQIGSGPNNGSEPAGRLSIGTSPDTDAAEASSASGPSAAAASAARQAAAGGGEAAVEVVLPGRPAGSGGAAGDVTVTGGSGGASHVAATSDNGASEAAGHGMGAGGCCLPVC